VWTGLLAERQKGYANFVESFAEAEKTWRMVGSPLENARRFVRDFRRSHRQLKQSLLLKLTNGKAIDVVRRSRGYARALNNFAAAEWLRFRYGIKPLMADVAAGIKACSEVYDFGPKRYTSRNAKQIVSTSRVRTDLIDGSYTIGSTCAATSSVSIRAMCVDSFRMTPFDKVGLTFHNLVGVAWEMTHYSFVVDWFANVSDLIYANIPRANCVYLGGCTTTKWNNNSFYFCDKFLATGSTVTSAPTDTVTATNVTTVRIPRNLGHGGLVLRDDFRLDTWIRASDAIALLQQQLGRVSFN